MIVKDSFYVSRYGDDAYRAKFVSTASVIEYISHKEFQPDYFDQKFFTIKCILNKNEEIILRAKNHLGCRSLKRSSRMCALHVCLGLRPTAGYARFLWEQRNVDWCHHRLSSTTRYRKRKFH